MSKSSSKTPDIRSQPPVKSAAVLVLGDIADTTWRMFIPTVGATALGMWADKHFGTTPWLLIVGIIVGTTVAALLVRRQLKKVSG